MRTLRLHHTAVLIVALVFALGLSACAGDEPESPTSTPAPAPTATAIPPTVAVATPTATPAAPEPGPAMAGNAEKLAQYAAEHAGGPGAIFVGDPLQLIGLPPHEGLMFEIPEAD